MKEENYLLEQQIEILKEKGLIIKDTALGKQILQHFNFFDIIKVYKNLFIVNNVFVKNTTIEKVFLFYHYDRGIQNILFKYSVYIERIFKNRLAEILSQEIGITKQEYLKIENYTVRNNNNLILNNTLKEIRDVEGISEHPSILLKKITFSTTINLYNFLNEKLKEKMIYFNYKDNEKQQAKNLFRNSLYIIRRYRNEIAHSMDFINYRAERYIIFRYLKKILNEYGYIKLMNKNDYSKRQRGPNDIFSMMLSVILLLGNEFLRIEMLKELEMFINKENKEKFKSYAEITNLPDNFLDRLQETLKEKKNNYLFRS
ncbi:Abi family protein [Leptotrichia hongkongensis]|uniref:Abi family protein n=1 Tax=Leptotrichia hongkongensis TaxID=554406 RepID=A0ABV4S341_9FUSO